MDSHPYRHAALWSVLALAAAGCSSEAPTEVGSTHVKSATIVANDGGGLEVTASDYAPYAGARIDIPAGALAADTKMVIDLGPDSIIDATGTAVGPAITFGPAGAVLSAPAQITLPYSGSVDRNRARIYVRLADGSTDVVLPTGLTIDAPNRLMRFSLQSMATVQVGRASDACQHITCATGNCRDGQCRVDCTDEDCGPAPLLPSYLCSDGSVSGPVCEADAAGRCGWQIRTCPGECETDADCGSTGICDDGVCQTPPGEDCGGIRRCGADEFCCNPSCGICAPTGGACIEPACGRACGADGECAPGWICSAIGTCVPGERCGRTTCGDGLTCCNPSCGVCVPPGSACTQEFCEWFCQSDADCAEPFPTCTNDGRCE